MNGKIASMALSPENAELNPLAIMGDEKGLYFTFMSDMSAIAQILPPPLEPAFPLVSGYIVNVDKPSFAEPYREAMLGVYVKFGDTIGMYPVSFLLCGPGAEMATYLGREKTGLPKKLCETEDCIQIERNGDVLRGTAKRKGVMLLDVSIKLGKYNNPICAGPYAGYEAGNVTGGTSFYFQTVLEPDENGKAQFTKVNMLSNVAEYKHRVWQPGEVTVRLQSSKDDAWGQFPVYENLGGAYAENDLEMKELFIVARPEPCKAIPMLLTNRFDKSALKEEE